MKCSISRNLSCQYTLEPSPLGTHPRAEDKSISAEIGIFLSHRYNLRYIKYSRDLRLKVSSLNGESVTAPDLDQEGGMSLNDGLQQVRSSPIPQSSRMISPGLKPMP